MKRFLSLTLTLLMILSCFAISASAAPEKKCLMFNDDGAYAYFQGFSTVSTDCSISFDLSMEPENGNPSLDGNGIFRITSSSVSVGSKSAAINWGKLERKHWRRFDITFKSGTTTIALDGENVLSAPSNGPSGNFYFLGWPGYMLLDNFVVKSAGIAVCDVNFDDENAYNSRVSGDSSTSRTTVPDGSYYDYNSAVAAEDVSYIFNNPVNCQKLSVETGVVKLRGDLNDDGEVNGRDSRILKGLIVGDSLGSYSELIADVNADGEVSSRDSLLMKKIIVGTADPMEVTVGGNGGAAEYDLAMQCAKLAVNSTVTDGIDANLLMDEIKAEDYSYAVITYMTPASTEEHNSSAAVSAGFGAWGNFKSFDLECDGSFHSEIVDLSTISTWNGDAATLRFFNAANTGDTMYVDSIIFCSTLSKANTAAETREGAKRSFRISDEPVSEGLGHYSGSDYVVPFDTEGRCNYVSAMNNSEKSYDVNMNALKAMTTAQADPSIYVDLSEENISANTFKYLVYTYMIPSSIQREGPRANMYYVCGSINEPTSGYETDIFSCSKSGEFAYEIIDLSAKSNWNGAIKGIRIDYFTDAPRGDFAYIDSLVFCTSLGAAKKAGDARLLERNGPVITEDDTASIWNTYWKYYKNSGVNEFIAGDDTDLQMYFRYSTDSSKFTARSLGDRLARAISEATGKEITCTVYQGFNELKDNWGNANPSAPILYSLKYNDKSYVIYLRTNIIKTAGYTDVLDGTSADPAFERANVSTWESAGVSITESTKLPDHDGGLGGHSNHESRIVDTPYGTFAVYTTWSNKDTWAVMGGSRFTIFRIYDDGTYKAIGTYDSNYHTTKPQIFYAGDGKVYVICADAPDGNNASIFVGYFDPSKPNADGSYNITQSRTSHAFPAGNVPTGYGYSVSIPDNTNGKFYILYNNGGTTPGYYLTWFTYNYLTHKFESSHYSVISNAYRQAYNYGYADGKGGFYFVAERDCLLSCVGLAGIVYGADYVWDELAYFHVPNANSTSVIYKVIVPADYTQRDRELYPNTQNNYGGDTYITSDGYMHVISTTSMHGRFHHDVRYRQLWHDIYDLTNPSKPSLLYSEPIRFAETDNHYNARMTESTDGTIYIIAMSNSQSSRCEVWRAANDLASEFELVACRNFDERATLGTSIVIGNNRSGSVIDNTVSCMYPTSGNGYYFFTVNLPE